MFKIDENITDNIRAFFRYTQDANDQDYRADAVVFGELSERLNPGGPARQIGRFSPDSKHSVRTC